MNTQNKTIFITGGGSGIGFAFAKAFSEKGNQVIISGRDENKLSQAVSALTNTTYIVCDNTNEADVENLQKKIETDFGKLDILINNAGVAYAYQLSATADAYTKAKTEMDINFLSIVRLTEKLLPVLARQNEAAIVNVSSIAAFTPAISIATYSATKAALHSYTQSLRLTLEKTLPHIKVFEVMPPFVDTPMTEKITAPKISADEVANDLLESMKNDRWEVHNGITKEVFQKYFSLTEKAFRAGNGEAV